MSTPRQSRLRRQRPVEVEAEPEVALEEMEQATQRLRDQAWKLNAVTRPPLISEESVRRSPSAADSKR